MYLNLAYRRKGGAIILKILMLILSVKLYDQIAIFTIGKKTKVVTFFGQTIAINRVNRILRNSLSNYTMLSFPLADAKHSLTTDGSALAIGAVLSQFNNNVWEPLGFYSKKLSETERKYSTFHRELLAVYASIKHFRKYLDGSVCGLFETQTTRIRNSIKFEKNPRKWRQLDYIS